MFGLGCIYNTVGGDTISAKDQTKDMATLSGANLLDHYLTNTKEQLKEVIDPIKQPNLYQLNKFEIREKLNKNVRSFLARLTSKKAKIALNTAMNDLREQLDEKYQLLEYTKVCITNLDKAIDFGIAETFGRKDSITDSSILAILQNIGVLKKKLLIPDAALRALEEFEED